MTEEISWSERIGDPMRVPIEDYAQFVRELAGPNALGLVLFGSIVAGTFDRSRQTVRNVLVLERIDLAMLRRLAEKGMKLGKARIAAPLIMTPSYIQETLDAFPLELIEIHQCHVRVFGTDYFDDLSFDESHIRIQCERELKSILIGMRQGLLASGGREKWLGALEEDIAERLLRTLRGMLWLKGERTAKSFDQVIAHIERIAGRSLPGVRSALRLGVHHGWEEFQGLYHDVEALGKVANGW